MLELARDAVRFLKVRKKYWLLPILIALLMLSLAVIVSQSATMTFIYTVF